MQNPWSPAGQSASFSKWAWNQDLFEVLVLNSCRNLALCASVLMHHAPVNITATRKTIRWAWERRKAKQFCWKEMKKEQFHPITSNLYITQMWHWKEVLKIFIIKQLKNSHEWSVSSELNVWDEQSLINNALTVLDLMVTKAKSQSWGRFNVVTFGALNFILERAEKASSELPTTLTPLGTQQQVQVRFHWAMETNFTSALVKWDWLPPLSFTLFK